MSGVTRRGVLQGGALAGAALAVPAAGAALRDAALVVYDSRLPASLAFARTVGSVRTLDLAGEHAALFAGLRGPLPPGRAVEGLTRWSDWTGVRKELERQGWRVSAEAPVGHGQHLFRWTMQPRKKS